MPEHEVFFASEYAAKDASLPGVRRIPLGKSRSAAEKGPAWWNAIHYDWEMMAKRGFAARQALLALRKEGVVPDIVCATAAMGHGLFAHDVFPDSLYVFYADCYYPSLRGEEADIRYAARRRFHNMQELSGLADADVRLVATEWQKRQFPSAFRENLLVMPYGVDTEWFSPRREARAPEEHILFSARCAEVPLFPGVLKRIPEVIRHRPGCRISVMANGLPLAQRQAMERLSGLSALPPGRLAFVETKNIMEYRRLLRSASVYVYLTNPFALSGGLFEAMSCGCLPLCSDTEPVREIIRDGENGFLCKEAKVSALWEQALHLAECPHVTGPIRKAARTFIVARHSLKRVLPFHISTLLTAYEEWRAGKGDAESPSPSRLQDG